MSIDYHIEQRQQCFNWFNDMSRKSVLERQVIAKSIVHFYIKIPNRSKRETVHHFLRQGEKSSTVYSVINRYDRNSTSEFKPKPGRTPSVATPEVLQKVKRKFINRNTTGRCVRNNTHWRQEFTKHPKKWLKSGKTSVKYQWNSWIESNVKCEEDSETDRKGWSVCTFW